MAPAQQSTKRVSASSRPASLITSEPTTTIPSDDQPDLESPSLSTPQARARFEFESGKANDGTKILMLEWEDDEHTQQIRGTWTVSWEGKSHVLPAEERRGNEDGGTTSPAQQQTHRLFFLLPPGVSIPTTVTLAIEPSVSPGSQKTEPVIWKTNPLPAIFPPGLYESALSPGNTGPKRPSKGVLHTLWAKKRLSTLALEIAHEERDFPEGIGLEMALKEVEWIESTFGISNSSSSGESNHRLSMRGLNEVPLSPSTPLSPGGSRLAEKLKGLKLQTGAGNLTPASGFTGRGPLSPDDADIAVPSFSAFRGANPGILAAKPAQIPESLSSIPVQPEPQPQPQVQTQKGPQPQPQPWRKPVLAPSRSSTVGSMNSLAGMLSDGAAAEVEDGDGEGEEGDLFAMPLSPRSPDMTKSPFSFAKGDVRDYVKSTS